MRSGGRSAAPWTFAAAALALALALGVAAYAGFAGGETASPPAPASTPAAAAPAPRDEHVDVAVESEPAGAHLTLDGEARGQTPLTLTLPRSDAERTLRLERDGFAAVEETFRPDVDQRLRLTLPPAADPEPAPGANRTEARDRPAGRPRSRPQRTVAAPAATPAAPAEPAEPGDERQRAFRRFN